MHYCTLSRRSLSPHSLAYLNNISNMNQYVVSFHTYSLSYSHPNFMLSNMWLWASVINLSIMYSTTIELNQFPMKIDVCLHMFLNRVKFAIVIIQPIQFKQIPAWTWLTDKIINSNSPTMALVFRVCGGADRCTVKQSKVKFIDGWYVSRANHQIKWHAVNVHEWIHTSLVQHKFMFYFHSPTFQRSIRYLSVSHCFASMEAAQRKHHFEIKTLNSDEKRLKNKSIPFWNCWFMRMVDETLLWLMKVQKRCTEWI